MCMNKYRIFIPEKILPLALCILLILASTACQSARESTPPSPTPRVLTVTAASSLTDAFTDIAAAFEANHPGVKVEFNFAGSQQLAQQLTSGARGFFFASANKKQMDVVVENGRVIPQDVSAFATNRLVVIYPSDNPGAISSLADLARPGVKVLLAAPEVPVGQYSLEFLEKASRMTEFGADFKEHVLANVVSYEASVKGAVTKVRLGEADVTIVYATDITSANQAELGSLPIPDELNLTAEYSIAPLADGDREMAELWIAFLQSNTGEEYLRKYGFQPLRQP